MLLTTSYDVRHQTVDRQQVACSQHLPVQPTLHPVLVVVGSDYVRSDVCSAAMPRHQKRHRTDASALVSCLRAHLSRLHTTYNLSRFALVSIARPFCFGSLPMCTRTPLAHRALRRAPPPLGVALVCLRCTLRASQDGGGMNGLGALHAAARDGDARLVREACRLRSRFCSASPCAPPPPDLKLHETRRTS